MAGAMAEHPQDSTPGQAGDWPATLGCYRFLNNQRVDPQAIVAAASDHTRTACASLKTVLHLHDLSPIDPVYQVSATRLLQHTVLAVDGGNDGQVQGLLHQHWFDDPKAPPGETRGERQARWTRSQTWPEGVVAVGSPPIGSRWITVADREADDLQLFDACRRHGQGFVVRSQHNRCLVGDGRLHDSMAARPVVGGAYVTVPRRSAVGSKAPPKRRRSASAPRTARVRIRQATVTLARPQKESGLTVRAVWVHEVDPPAGVAPIQWLLITSEPVNNLADALRVIQWYRKRWLIEEFHKAQKTGCRLEKSQLQSGEAIQRFASICAVVAVRLLKLRQVANDPRTARQLALKHHNQLWVQVVARLIGCATGQLTVRQFYLTLARRGGWLGRKHDGPPGWQTLWRGYRRIADYVAGIELLRQPPPQEEESCV